MHMYIAKKALRGDSLSRICCRYDIELYIWHSFDDIDECIFRRTRDRMESGRKNEHSFFKRFESCIISKEFLDITCHRFLSFPAQRARFRRIKTALLTVPGTFRHHKDFCSEQLCDIK